MAIDVNSIIRTSRPIPTIDLVYGTSGIGKTTFGASYPDPIFIQTERGEGELDIATFGVLTTFEQVMEALEALRRDQHSFKTVVVDSLGWLEPLVHDKVCRENGWKDLGQPGYGKGPIAANSRWKDFFDEISRIRNKREMGVALLAHVTVKEVKNPDVEAYEQFQPKLHKDVVDTAIEYADNAWLLTRRVSIVKDNDKDPLSRARGVGGDKRILWTVERPGHRAKNRYKMPAQITMPDNPAMMFPTVAPFIPYYAQMLNGGPATETQTPANAA